MEYTNITVCDKYGTPKFVATNKKPGTCHFRNAPHHMQLGGAYDAFKIEIQSDHKHSHHVEKNGFLIVKDREGDLVEFQILELVEKDGWFYIVAENSFVSQLHYNYVRPVILRANSAKQAMQHILQGTGVQVGIVEWFGVQDFEFKDIPNAVSALLKVKEAFDEGEFKFRITMQGNRITGRYIDLVNKRGRNRGLRFEYGKNIEEAERSISDIENEVFTAVIGVGPSDPNGNPMNFANVTAADKPLGDDFIGDEEARQKYGIWRDGKMEHRMGIFQYNEAQTPEELLIKSRKYLKEHKEPEFSYKVKVSLLGEDVGLGDTVTILDDTFKPAITLEARVVEYIPYYDDPSKDEVVLGNYNPIKPRFNLEDLYKEVGKNKGKWESPFVPPHIGPTPPIDTNRRWLDNSNGVPYTPYIYDDITQGWVLEDPSLEQQYQNDFMEKYDVAVNDIAQAEYDITNIFNDLDKKLTIDTDYDGIKIGVDYGLVSTRNDNMTQVVLDAENGMVMRRWDSGTSAFVNTLWTDPQTGNAKFGGDLAAASGTFAGSLVAASGTFAGELTAATGSFTGELIAASGTFGGDVEGAVIRSSRFESLYGDQMYLNAVLDVNGNITDYGGRFDTSGPLMRMQRDDGNYISIADDAEIAMWANSYRFFEFNAVEAQQHSFIRGGNVALKFLNGTDTMIQVRNATDTAYRSMKADEFVQVSDPKEKKDIEKFKGSALKGVLSTPFYQFRMKGDRGTELKRFGAMLDEVPVEIVSPSGGIIPYAASLYSMKAIQELHQDNETEHQKLLKKINDLENKINMNINEKKG